MNDTNKEDIQLIFIAELTPFWLLRIEILVFLAFIDSLENIHVKKGSYYFSAILIYKSFCI